MANLKLGYMLRDDGACSYYRVDLPIQKAAQKAGWAVEKYVYGQGEEKLLRIVEEADIFVIPRVGETQIMDIIEMRRSKGLKTVIDWDDNIFEVSPLSQHYKDFGCYDIQVNDKWVWIDGHNYNRQMNIERMEAIRLTMQNADLITCTTPQLASVFDEHNPRVAVLPNCLDLNIWRPCDKLQRNDHVRLLWTGGISHYEDWLTIGPAVVEVLHMYPFVKLVLMGAHFQGSLKGVNPDQIEYHHGVHFQAYPYKLMLLRGDIGIIPLADTTFNAGKSALKWIEMAALGIPCISSYVGPYRVIADEDAPGLFIQDNDHGRWVNALSSLIQDSLLRASIAGDALEYVELNYDIDRNTHRWITAYEGLLGGDNAILSTEDKVESMA